MFSIKDRFLNFCLLLGLLSLVNYCNANFVNFNSKNSQICSGVYSKHDWGGSMRPHIGLNLKSIDKKKKIKEGDTQDYDITYVIFEYKDLNMIGKFSDDGKAYYICDQVAIESGYCEESNKGKFIVSHAYPNSTVMTGQLTKLGDADFHYDVNRTGYYCMLAVSLSNKDFTGQVNFQNAFGYLSASEIPKLPAYGILTLCYAVASALFAFQFFKKRKENQILPLQKYLLGILGFLTFDTLVVWSYYDLVNGTKSPSNGFNIFYMIFLSLLNAFKTTAAFFILLCISLGYGVVRVKLSKKIMFRCRILAGFHFLASCYYLIATYYFGNSSAVTTTSSSDLNNSSVGLYGIIPLIPVTITLAVYYICILASIRSTTASLHQQRQIIKLQLYQRLFKMIFFSICITLLGLILSSFIYLSMSTTDMIEQHWKGAFFLFDFWPSVVFFGVFLGIAWLWRPTETSYMLAVSQQLSNTETPSDDEGQQGYQQGNEFELDDMSLISHSENEAAAEGNDSFELPRESYPVKSEHPDLSVGEGSTEASNTLFELGEESDNEDKTDDRIKDK